MKKPNPYLMSQRELEDYLDALVEEGKDDTPEFHKAHRVREKNS